MSYIKELDNEYVAATYNRFNVELISGKGSLFFDSDGKSYIDLTSGIGVTSFGNADSEWINAINTQLNKLQHTSNLYYTEPCAKLAELLCKKTGMSKVFFANSGAEANECAIKIARKYATDKKGAEYYNIITIENSFHGRTLTTLAATGQEHYHKLFNPLTSGFIHTPAEDIETLKVILAENKCAAIMLECVQGEGGVIPLSHEYINQVACLAKEKDILISSIGVLNVPSGVWRRRNISGGKAYLVLRVLCEGHRKIVVVCQLTNLAHEAGIHAAAFRPICRL